jgi:hypothetical protein
MSYEERRRLAYHEAGHAYVAVKLLYKWRLSKVTIIRHGGALGFAGWKPEEETYTTTKKELLNQLQISLASRACEEIFLNIQMSGVTSDLAGATWNATRMIGAFGMDDTFYSYLAFGMEGMAAPDMKVRVEAILKEQFRQVKRLIENNKEAVIAIAEALILRNELTDIDVDEILARVEATHPFTNSDKEDSRPLLGFAPRALPAPANGRRNGHGNGNGKVPDKQPEPVIVPASAQSSAEPPGPVADLHDDLAAEDDERTE